MLRYAPTHTHIIICFSFHFSSFILVCVLWSTAHIFIRTGESGRRHNDGENLLIPLSSEWCTKHVQYRCQLQNFRFIFFHVIFLSLSLLYLTNHHGVYSRLDVTINSHSTHFFHIVYAHRIFLNAMPFKLLYPSCLFHSVHLFGIFGIIYSIFLWYCIRFFLSLSSNQPPGIRMKHTQ